MRHLVAVLALTAAGVAMAGAAQAPPDFSGRWVSSPEQFTTIGRQPAGWEPHLSGVRGTSRYPVAVHHAGDSITLTFPGGGENVLNRPTFTIGAQPESVLWDRGEWWVKTESHASWDGTQLTLRAVSVSAWWRDAEPAAAVTQPTQLETTFVLALDAPASTLTMTVTVADDKGTATYRQQFRRAR